MSAELYRYRVVAVRRVVDGDTLDLDIDLGFHMTAALRFRVLGVDTPERGQPGWAEATAFVREWVEAAGALVVMTRKADSFGRWLADVHRAEDEACLSHALLGAGHAVHYER